MWYSSLKAFLVDKGFATLNDDTSTWQELGELFWVDESQASRISNNDESGLAVDDTQNGKVSAVLIIILLIALLQLLLVRPSHSLAVAFSCFYLVAEGWKTSLWYLQSKAQEQSYPLSSQEQFPLYTLVWMLCFWRKVSRALSNPY
jgi:hypothetical protein